MAAVPGCLLDHVSEHVTECEVHTLGSRDRIRVVLGDRPSRTFALGFVFGDETCQGVGPRQCEVAVWVVVGPRPRHIAISEVNAEPEPLGSSEVFDQPGDGQLRGRDRVRCGLIVAHPRRLRHDRRLQEIEQLRQRLKLSARFGRADPLLSGTTGVVNALLVHSAILTGSPAGHQPVSRSPRALSRPVDQ
jgi:hypothetical protein